MINTNSSIQLLSAKWVIPICPHDTVLDQHSVAIEHGKIIDCLSTKKALKKYPNATHKDYADHVIMPGLINAHTHSPMNLFRGMADDMPLSQWLNDHIWPAESKWLSPDFVRDGAQLAIAEMLLSGTTCFNDMYLFPDVIAHTAQDIGIRAVVGLIVIGFPSAWAQSTDEYFERGLQVHDDVHALSLVTTAMAPHAPYTVDDDTLQRIQLYADELLIPVHMHVHETAQEIEDALQQNKQRPLSRLKQLGLLTPRLLAVHMTQLSQEEIEWAAEYGINIAHCPKSNLKLNSGYCPVRQLNNAHVNVCIGTDGAASNNSVNMLEETRQTALLAKTVANDACAVSAHKALQMATINAAKALGLDEQVGSIEIGKSADLIAINLNHIATQPVYDAPSQIVYSANAEQVTDVWVAGQQLVKDKQLTTIDTQSVLRKSAEWAEKIRA